MPGECNDDPSRQAVHNFLQGWKEIMLDRSEPQTLSALSRLLPALRDQMAPTSPNDLLLLWEVAKDTNTEIGLTVILSSWCRLCVARESMRRYYVFLSMLGWVAARQQQWDWFSASCEGLIFRLVRHFYAWDDWAGTHTQVEHAQTIATSITLALLGWSEQTLTLLDPATDAFQSLNTVEDIFNYVILIGQDVQKHQQASGARSSESDVNVQPHSSGSCATVAARSAGKAVPQQGSFVAAAPQAARSAPTGTTKNQGSKSTNSSSQVLPLCRQRTGGVAAKTTSGGSNSIIPPPHDETSAQSAARQKGKHERIGDSKKRAEKKSNKRKESCVAF